jgi:hypothetical protein
LHGIEQLEADDLFNTAVQILGLWHVKASILSNVSSTDVRTIRNPEAIGYVTFAPRQVWRGRADAEGA